MQSKKILREYFLFDRQRRRALLALIIISVMAVATPLILATVEKTSAVSTAKLDSVRKILYAEDSWQNYPAIQREDISGAALFYFDPNTASQQEWIALGIKEDLAKRITKYTAKGGKYYKKDDLLKTYGFRQKDLERLSAFMIFEGDHKKTDTDFSGTAQQDKIYKMPDSEFDPNIISKDDWIDMGIADYIAERIIHYLEKGGVFRKPEDLLKTYGFKTEDYERLKTFMIFDSDEKNVSVSASAGNSAMSVAQQNISIERHTTELNAATKEQLEALGFSGEDANHILNYRKGLGGFYSAEQIKDIDGLDQEVVRDAGLFLLADRKGIEKMNINTATYEQLEKHIYISAALAQAIIDYRNTYGNFVALSEIKKVKGMYAGLYDKINIYLTI